jgi:hypothetical protein
MLWKSRRQQSEQQHVHQISKRLAFECLEVRHMLAATFNSVQPSNGFTVVNITGVSSDGAVVVGHGLSTSGSQSFRWTADGGMQGLGDLPGGVFDSQANAISADGSTIVGVGHSANGRQAYRWTETGGMVALGNFPGSEAHGVSADGSTIVGDYLPNDFGGGSEAFRWTATSGLVGLSRLPGHFSSYAYGVSADGTTIVGDSSAISFSEAFRWTAGAGIVGLGHPSGSSSWAGDASANGESIVGYYDDQAFRWTNTVGQPLGELPSGVIFSEALSVSSDGSMAVGRGFWNDGSSKAVIWTGSEEGQLVQDVLSAIPELDLTGWTLTKANEIHSDEYQTVIVGNGIDPSGNYRGWVARITNEPDPTPFNISVSTTGGLDNPVILGGPLDEVTIHIDIVGELPAEGDPTQVITTVDLYWATGPSEEDITEGEAAFESFPITSLTTSFTHVVDAQTFADAPSGATHMVVIVDRTNTLEESNEGDNTATEGLFNLSLTQFDLDWNRLRHDADQQAAGAIWRGIDVTFRTEALGSTAEISPRTAIPFTPEIRFYWASDTTAASRFSEPRTSDSVNWRSSSQDSSLGDMFAITNEVGTFTFNENALWGKPEQFAYYIHAVIDPDGALGEANENDNFATLKLESESNVFQNAISAYATQGGTAIQIDFSPGGGGISLSAAEVSLGIHHFNWIQAYKLPVGVSVRTGTVGYDDATEQYSSPPWEELSEPVKVPREDLFSFETSGEKSYWDFYAVLGEDYVEQWPGVSDLLVRSASNLLGYLHDGNIFYLNDNRNGDGIREWHRQNGRGGTVVDQSVFRLKDRPFTPAIAANGVTNYKMEFETRIVGVTVAELPSDGMANMERWNYDDLAVRWSSNLVANSPSHSGTGTVFIANAGSVGDLELMDMVGGIGPIQLLPKTNADLDSDGDIDGRDFLAWQRGYGKPNATRADGDANSDGSVDSEDLAIWQDQYGTGVAALSSQQSNAAPVLATIQAVMESPDGLQEQSTLPVGFWIDLHPSVESDADMSTALAADAFYDLASDQSFQSVDDISFKQRPLESIGSSREADADTDYFEFFDSALTEWDQLELAI